MCRKACLLFTWLGRAVLLVNTNAKTSFPLLASMCVAVFCNCQVASGNFLVLFPSGWVGMLRAIKRPLSMAPDNSVLAGRSIPFGKGGSAWLRGDRFAVFPAALCLADLMDNGLWLGSVPTWVGSHQAATLCLTLPLCRNGAVAHFRSPGGLLGQI